MKLSTVAAGFVALALLGAGRCAAARGCSEHSRIVGVQHCNRYGGTWSDANELPPLWSDASFTVHLLSLRGSTFTAAQSSAGPAFALRGDQFARGLSLLAGASTRGAVHIGRFFYTGVDFGVATGATGDGQLLTAGSVGIAPQSLTYFSGGAFVGAAATAGRVTGRLEFAAGARNIAVGTTEFFREQSNTGEADAFQLLFEPRAGVDFWVASGITLGVWGGLELSPGADVGVVTGLSIGGHTRTFR